MICSGGKCVDLFDSGNKTMVPNDVIYAGCMCGGPLTSAINEEP